MKIAIYFICLCALTSSLGQTTYLTIEPNHSTVGFEVPIASGVTKVTGKFMDFDLKLAYVDKDWTKSSIDFTIQAKSITTGIPDRDDHLRTADFFDVEAYPVIKFVSSSITQRKKAYIAKGTFTMHGVSREVSIPFVVTSEKGNTIGIHIETSVNRIEYGVGAEFKHTSIENFLSEEIPVKIDFWTKKDKRF